MQGSPCSSKVLVQVGGALSVLMISDTSNCIANVFLGLLEENKVPTICADLEVERPYITKVKWP